MASSSKFHAGFHASGFAVQGNARFASDLWLTRRKTVSDNAVESRVKIISTDTGFNSTMDPAARDARVIGAGASVVTLTWFVDLKGSAEAAETGLCRFVREPQVRAVFQIGRAHV